MILSDSFQKPKQRARTVSKLEKNGGRGGVEYFVSPENRYSPNFAKRKTSWKGRS